MGLFRKILCLMDLHTWTCAAEEGIEPTPEQLKPPYTVGFAEYAKSYCKHCGRTMDASQRFIDQSREQRG